MKEWITRHSPDNEKADYGIQHFRLLEFVKDVRFYESYFKSGQRILVTELTTPAKKIVRFCSRKPRNIQRYNIQNFISERVRSKFCDKLESKLMSLILDPNNIKGSNNDIISTLAKARKTIP